MVFTERERELEREPERELELEPERELERKLEPEPELEPEWEPEPEPEREPERGLEPKPELEPELELERELEPGLEHIMTVEPITAKMAALGFTPTAAGTWRHRELLILIRCPPSGQRRIINPWVAENPSEFLCNKDGRVRRFADPVSAARAAIAKWGS
jgi:hypothetical protein